MDAWASPAMANTIGHSADIQQSRHEFAPIPKGLRDRNSPTCTLSQNGYGVE